MAAAREASERTRRGYDRVAPVYDAVEWVMERRVKRRREERVPSGFTLEVGVGTGGSIPYYPAGGDVQCLPHADGTFDAVVATFSGAHTSTGRP